MEARPVELAAWLADPTFFSSDNPLPPGSPPTGGEPTTSGSDAAPTPVVLDATATITRSAKPPVRRIVLPTPTVRGVATIRRTIAFTAAGTYALEIRVRGTSRILPLRKGTLIGTRTLTQRAKAPAVRVLRKGASVRLKILLDPLTRPDAKRGIELLISLVHSGR